MRIAIQHVLPAEEGSEAAKLIQRWDSLVRQNVDLVKSEGTEVVFRIPRRGLTGLDAFCYTYMNRLNDMETLYGVMQAEEESYDAVIELCLFDPILREARQAVDIPVVGPGEAAMLLPRTL